MSTPSGEDRFAEARALGGALGRRWAALLEPSGRSVPGPRPVPLRLAYVRLLQAELALHLAALDEPRLEEGDWLLRTLEPVVRAKRQVERAALSLGVDLVNEEG